MSDNMPRIGVIGLGYVGLPLCVEFSKIFSTVGYDIDEKRIEHLKAGVDENLEISGQSLGESRLLTFTSQLEDLKGCDTFIVTVPTPVKANKQPDLGPLSAASEMIGSLLSRGDLVVFESTVYPGVTEDVCVPILERISSLKLGQDFDVGYSPERINPGDNERKLPDILKITSGSSPLAASRVSQLYSKIITAGIYEAPSIKVAEAAKLIENVQRDVNIALMNELNIIFRKLNLNVHEVIDAASTKWNFLKFTPGFVGGHCISVDPYYLISKAGESGALLDIISASRKINESVPVFAAQQFLERLDDLGVPRREMKILILGYTFKEDCPDVRNTKVADFVRYLQPRVSRLDIYDPYVSEGAIEHSHSASFLDAPGNGYDGIFIATAHREFKDIGLSGISEKGKKQCVIVDYKNIFGMPELTL